MKNNIIASNQLNVTPNDQIRTKCDYTKPQGPYTLQNLIIQINAIHCISVIPLSDTARNRLKGGF